MTKAQKQFHLSIAEAELKLLEAQLNLAESKSFQEYAIGEAWTTLYNAVVDDPTVPDAECQAIEAEMNRNSDYIDFVTEASERVRSAENAVQSWKDALAHDDEW